MSIDLSSYRGTEREQARTQDLLDLTPSYGGSVLDVGARDGYLSRLLAARFDQVVALDLEKPEIVHPRIEPVKGDATALEFEDNKFDTVVCSEVLEHIPVPSLQRACREIGRVAKRTVVIGVPYKQDIRCGRSTCRACGKPNPPWGHVNSFDELRLQELFRDFSVAKLSYVGTNPDWTNSLSTVLLDFAGNPYGTYEQDELCVHCGDSIGPPTERKLIQKLATKAAYLLNRAQRPFTNVRAQWVHVRFEKSSANYALPAF
jgi:SAM-dependent methyltransferase